MKATSKIFANPRIMKAFARKGTGAANAQQTAGKVASALDAGLAGMAATQRPIRQAGVRAVGINPQFQRPGPIVETEEVAPVAPPSTASGIGQVDVFGSTLPIGARGSTNAGRGNLRQMATNNPAVAQALGIRGATAGLL